MDRKIAKKSLDKSRQSIWNHSTRAYREECKLPLMPKKAILDASLEKVILLDEIRGINDHFYKVGLLFWPR